MVKFIKNILIVSIALISSTCFAASSDSNNDYDADYYEDEGRLLFKIRAHAIKSNAKQKKLSTPTSATPQAVGAFAENGYGAETATTIFFNDNIAAELSLGFSVIKVKSTSLSNIANNYGGTLGYTKKRAIYMVPLTLAGQYHLAPFGAVRPYVGGGYHAAYMFTKAKEFKINNGHGPMVQAGVDFVAKDDTLINLDIKQYILSSKVTYKGAIVGSNRATSTVKFNPLVISIGIGFMF
jgi:outer membrane protein